MPLRPNIAFFHLIRDDGIHDVEGAGAGRQIRLARRRTLHADIDDDIARIQGRREVVGGWVSSR
jgi:hypothetical protein